MPDPDRPPGAFVHIPDLVLRAAIAEKLGKSPNTPITAEEMKKVTELNVQNKGNQGIRDLTGLQFATNLRKINFSDNEISDLSPLASLINLRELWLHDNPLLDISPVRALTNLTHLEVDTNELSDISPVRDLTNLVYLELDHTLVSDISPVRGLINLTTLILNSTLVSDLSPVAGLINLERLGFSNRNLSDLSPLAGLINLKSIHSWGNSISDLSPLSGLTKLEEIDICGGDIADLTPLAGLTGLTELYFVNHEISDISPLAGLTGLTRLSLKHNEVPDVSPLSRLTKLTWLELEDNEVSDISPLAGLTQLKWLSIAENMISDLSPLDGIRENITTLLWHDNPAFPKGGPKIEGPWLWVLVPDREVDTSTDLLSEASEGAVTEMGVSTHGATEGKAVSDDVWTSHRLPPSGGNNIGDMLQESIRDGVLYGTVSLYSPQQQETILYVGSEDEAKVWLNGELIYQNLRRRGAHDYTDFVPAMLKQGKNVLLVAVEIIGDNGSVFLGFEPGAEYTVTNPSIGYTFSKTPIYIDDTFTLDISAENVFDMAGWQFDIAFDPAILEAISVSEGNFLKTGGTTFFQGGSIDNVAGKITGLSAARLSTQGVTGTGVILQVRFKAKSGGETELVLQNFEFGTVAGESLPAGPHQTQIVVEGRLATGDVNRDGRVSILDLILVAQQLGRRVSAGSAVDLNGDGIVSILDLILAAQAIGGTTASAAPVAGAESGATATIETWIAQARLEDDGSLAFKQGIENLENLLASLIPEKTTLLRNYPNPFNPETWIPYQLAESAEVTLTIYDMNGQLVRRLAVGHQAAGMYQSRGRAAYWDGRNQLGESVASGLYFYTLTAGDFTATRRMLILK